jgi:hypothetical protein
MDGHQPPPVYFSTAFQHDSVAAILTVFQVADSRRKHPALAEVM